MYVRKLIPESKIINSSRQPSIMERLLTKARFTSKRKNVEVQRCGDRWFGMFNYIDEGL